MARWSYSPLSDSMPRADKRDTKQKNTRSDVLIHLAGDNTDLYSRSRDFEIYEYKEICARYFYNLSLIKHSKH